jgi:hypothetical protein
MNIGSRLSGHGFCHEYFSNGLDFLVLLCQDKRTEEKHGWERKEY